jgi:hypothetical protein
MPQVFFSPYFEPTYKKAINIFGLQAIKELMLDFILWKELGANPKGMTDKSSAKDDAGRVFRPYQRNQYRHVSFELSRNGDPVLAFRLMGNGDIMVICITSKHEMFALKSQFRRSFRDEFPKK